MLCLMKYSVSWLWKFVGSSWGKFENYYQKSVIIYLLKYNISKRQTLLTPPVNTALSHCRCEKSKKFFFIILELMRNVIKCLFSYQNVKWLWLVDTFSLYWDIFALNFIQIPWRELKMNSALSNTFFAFPFAFLSTRRSRAESSIFQH